MAAERYNSKQKQFYFKAYEHLELLEKDLGNFKKQGLSGLQISILGKVNEFYRDKNIDVSKNLNPLKLYWKKNLGPNTEISTLNNSDIGNFFIAGSLTSIFLERVEGKTLGMLSVGPHGILRGIGANEEQATDYLKLLKDGNYLLICRGCKEEFENLSEVLNDNLSM